jgi:hypothetical protein
MRLAGRRVPLAPKAARSGEGSYPPARGPLTALAAPPTPTEITHGVRNATSFLYGLAWPAETAAALGHQDSRARNLS